MTTNAASVTTCNGGRVAPPCNDCFSLLCSLAAFCMFGTAGSWSRMHQSGSGSFQEQNLCGSAALFQNRSELFFDSSSL